MPRKVFERHTRIPAPAREVFDWHLRPGAFERLAPPWQDVRVVERIGGIAQNGRAVLELRSGPLRRRWVAQHCDFEPGRQFRDVQVEGPFASWRHTHRVEPAGDDSCVLEDHVEYALPWGIAGDWLGGWWVRGRLEKLFEFRHQRTAEDIFEHRKTTGGKTMRILLTGSSGLIGTQVQAFLSTGGHQVTRLVRRSISAGEPELYWNPIEGLLDEPHMDEYDACIHLAGESIAAGRWTPETKQRIHDSRVQGTRVLCQTLARLPHPPKVIACASAIGYYGDRGDDVLTEESGPGDGFLPKVAKEWEAATAPAADRGIRVVNLRFGVVLSPLGGALAKMLTPFKLGVGGRIGSGEQFWSWVSIEDVVGAIHHALHNDAVQGPVNVVAPRPVTNREFTRTLGKVLRRPTIFPMPAFAARLALGEMADSLLLASARVEPAKLIATGYEFKHPDLETALRFLLGR